MFGQAIDSHSKTSRSSSLANSAIYEYRFSRMSSESESQLLSRCGRGDSIAWDELFERHYAAAGRFVYQLGPELSREDVEEICQETFLSVIKSLKSFKGGSRFQTWLFRIAVNKTRDHQARQRAAKRGGGKVPISLQEAESESGLLPDPPSHLPGPDAQVMSRERMLLIRNALDELGDPCRDVIELRYFGDLSYEEIASGLNLNPKTVSSRLSRCLDRFEELVRSLFARENSTPHSV